MTDKSHLLRFGYAPGNYWFVCPDCGDKQAVGDKRATRCEACAESLHAQITSVEAVADKHRDMTTVPEEAVKAAATALANYIGHGMTEKCVDKATVALTAALHHLPGVGEREAVLNYKAKLRVAFRKALSDLPEIAPTEIASILSSVHMQDEFWKEGKRLQLEHGLDAVAPRVEQECGAGAWSFIRRGILSALEPSAAQERCRDCDGYNCDDGCAYPEPSAARELALEEIIALCRDYGEDSQPDSEYRLACNDIIEAIQERRSLSSPDHADAGKVEGGGCKLKYTHSPYFRFYSDSDDLKIVKREGEYVLIEDTRGHRDWLHNSFLLPSAPSQEVAGT